MKTWVYLLIIFLFLQNSFIYSQTTPADIFNKGLEAYYGSKFENGINYFDEYIKSMSNDYKGYNYRGLCYQSLRDYQRAIDDFTRVVTIAKDNSEGYINRGNTFMLKGNFTSAISDFTDAIRINPNNMEAYIGRSRVYTVQGKFPNAIADLNSAIARDTKNARLYINKAWVDILADDTNKVFEDISNAMLYDSNIVFTNSKRDLLFMKLENYNNALLLTGDRIQTYPDSYLAYFSRGIIYFLMNRFQNSMDDLNKSEQLNINASNKYNEIMEKIIRSIRRNR